MADINGYCSMSDDDCGTPLEGAKRYAMYLPENVKTIHFIRHAEGHHNVARATVGREAYKDWKYEDARLTDYGLEQVRNAKQDAEVAGIAPQVVIVSPLTRTLQTAHGIFDPEKVPFVAYEGVRERYGVHPCDKRRTVEVLQPEFPHVDFTYIDVGEDSLWTPTRETEENVKLR